MSFSYGIDLGNGLSLGTDGHLRTDLGGVSLDLNDGSVGVKVGNMVFDSDGDTVMNSGDSSERDRSSFTKSSRGPATTSRSPTRKKKPWWKFW